MQKNRCFSAVICESISFITLRFGMIGKAREPAFGQHINVTSYTCLIEGNLSFM